MKRYRNEKMLEIVIMLVAVALTLIGIMAVYTAGSYNATVVRQAPFYYVTRQAMFAVVAWIVGIIVLNIKYKYLLDYGLLKRAAIVIIATLIGLLIFGTPINGAKAWIPIGAFSLQPSEFAKLLLIWATAYYFFKSRYMEPLSPIEPEGTFMKLWNNHHPEVTLGIIYSVVVISVLLQPDTGGAAIIVGTIGMMWLASGLIPWRKAIKWLTGIIVGGYAFIYLLSFVGGSDYRIRRILVFLNPFAASADDAIQIRNSFYALARGGLTGVGIGNSIQKTGYLPEYHTDFILSIIGEELGIIGVLLVVGLLITLIVLILRRSLTVSSILDKFILLGIGIMFAIQMFLNIAGVTSLAPLTGVTLPFISYGGSSLLMSYIAIALVLKISLHDKKIKRERREKERGEQHR